jgi:hypothetical protein
LWAVDPWIPILFSQELLPVNMVNLEIRFPLACRKNVPGGKLRIFEDVKNYLVKSKKPSIILNHVRLLLLPPAGSAPVGSRKKNKLNYK